MKIMLDKSPRHIAEYREKYQHDFWQLRTPLTRNAIGHVPWALDNGCFTRFDRKTWRRMVCEARDHAASQFKESSPSVFVTLPDIVGDARRTLELFDHFCKDTHGVQRALVLQDGIGQHKINWPMVDAVFVGGSDGFKIAPEAINACKTAKMMGKWVHVGRVNTAKRVRDWIGLADSIDGSGISRFDHMLEDVLAMLNRQHSQQELPISGEKDVRTD